VKAFYLWKASSLRQEVC